MRELQISEQYFQFWYSECSSYLHLQNNWKLIFIIKHGERKSGKKFCYLFIECHVLVCDNLHCYNVINSDNLHIILFTDFKKLIKMKTKNAAFRHLKAPQSKHSKIKHIKYDELKYQSYIFTNQEVNLLHSLRSRSVDCKVNFRCMYEADFDFTLC